MRGCCIRCGWKTSAVETKLREIDRLVSEKYIGETERGEALFEGEDYPYPSCVSGSGTFYVLTARHYVDIEPDDTYITLIYDRLGEHVEVEIPLPGREAQP